MFTRTEYRKIIKDFRKNIGIELTKFREERNLTREEVSDKLEMPIWIIEKLESGEGVSLDNIYALANFYNKKILLTFY